MCHKIILLMFFHLSSALFERCDELYKLDGDEIVTITSQGSLNAKNTSSCRYTVVAPVNYVVDITCKLHIDQFNSPKCPMKRFFVSVDGLSSLEGAEYFCSRNGSTRTVRRRSVVNRIVMGYVTKVAGGNESFTCFVRRKRVKCECGWSNKPHIYNGVNAGMHEFPSMIALVALSINRVFCGGVIISETWGLTGAHCFNEPIYANLTNVAALVGEHDLSKSNETIYTESYEIKEYIRHEQYKPGDYDQNNDIALLKMKKPFAFNRAVGPVCLPFGFDARSFDSKFVNVVGLGLFTFFGKPAQIVQKAALQIVPAKQCRDSARNDSKMCTYTEGKDSCTSDSGGPLYYTKRRQFLVGLVSYGVGCGQRTPSVNSRITSYLPWILKTTQDEASFCRKR